MKLSALIALTTLLGGCAVSGGRCYPVLGFGWTVVDTSQPGVLSTRTTVIGIGTLTRPSLHWVVGYGHTEAVSIETNNVTLEIK